VLRELEAIAPVEAVFGNMDEPALKELLPERRVIEVEGARIGMAHIAGPKVGREERLRSWFPGCDAVVYGHTHVPQLERHREYGSSTPAARPSGGALRSDRCSSSRSRGSVSSRKSSCSLDTNTCSR